MFGFLYEVFVVIGLTILINGMIIGTFVAIGYIMYRFGMLILRCIRKIFRIN